MKSGLLWVRLFDELQICHIKAGREFRKLREGKQCHSAGEMETKAVMYRARGEFSIVGNQTMKGGKLWLLL